MLITKNDENGSLKILDFVEIKPWNLWIFSILVNLWYKCNFFMMIIFVLCCWFYQEIQNAAIKVLLKVTIYFFIVYFTIFAEYGIEGYTDLRILGISEYSCSFVPSVHEYIHISPHVFMHVLKVVHIYLVLDMNINTEYDSAWLCRYLSTSDSRNYYNITGQHYAHTFLSIHIFIPPEGMPWFVYVHLRCACASFVTACMSHHVCP